MAICFIGLIKNKNLDCKEAGCSLWNEKHHECSVKSFLSSYRAIELMQIKLQNTFDRWDKEEDN